jgi:putative membrane protein
VQVHSLCDSLTDRVIPIISTLLIVFSRCMSSNFSSTEQYPEANTLLARVQEKTLSTIIYAVSAVIVLAVSVLIYFPQAFVAGKFDVSMLPKFHALLNGCCSVFLVASFLAIRKKKYQLHKQLNVTTFLFSSVFLVSYVVYHSQAPATPFGGQGWIRPVYFFILLTHIVLAAIILPLALFTIVRSWRGEFAKHKKIARITLPLWLYVTLTGVIVYFMIAPYYPVSHSTPHSVNAPASGTLPAQNVPVPAR